MFLDGPRAETFEVGGRPAKNIHALSSLTLQHCVRLPHVHILWIRFPFFSSRSFDLAQNYLLPFSSHSRGEIEWAGGSKILTKTTPPSTHGRTGITKTRIFAVAGQISTWAQFRQEVYVEINIAY